MIWKSALNSWFARLADFVTVFLSLDASYHLWLGFTGHSLISLAAAQHAFEHKAVAAFAFLFVLAMYQTGGYSYQRFTSISSELLMVARATVLSMALGIVLAYFAGRGDIPRTLILTSFIGILFVISLQKMLMYAIASRLRASGANRKRVLVVGTGTRAQNFVEIVREHFDWGLDIVGFLTGDNAKVGQTFYGYKVLDTFDRIEEILRTLNPQEVIITISTKRFDHVRLLLEACEREGVQVRLNSDFFGHFTKNVRVDSVYGLNIISFSTIRQSEAQLFFKRLIDIGGSLTALVLFSPLMIIAAIGIWFSDGAPIFYEWRVIGLDKRPFRGWKFRTMIRNADSLKKDLIESNEMDGPVFKIKNDPRVFPFGRWLRKWSIDESPQFFSVLKGDMSLVGPRPSFPHELERYQSWQRRRHSVKPGITCLWQVNGRNKIHKFDDWVRLDLEYIDNWTLWLDIKILLKTVPAVLTRKGAS